MTFPLGDATAADSIKGRYTFEGVARAKGSGADRQSRFRGKMRVGLKSVRLLIPVSRNGKVVTCKRMIRARLNRKLKRNPARAVRRAKFTNASCRNSTWKGTLRLRWTEHPEGYALSFSLGAVSVDSPGEGISGRFQGSTGTLSTEEPPPP